MAKVKASGAFSRNPSVNTMQASSQRRTSQRRSNRNSNVSAAAAKPPPAPRNYPKYPDYPYQYSGIPVQSFEQWLNPQQQALISAGNQPFTNLMQKSATFDPNNPYGGYQQGFEQSRQKAYDEIMSEFNRTNQEEFARQDRDFQQRMLEQGIDPNSATYQGQYKAYKDQQDRARANAMAQASQQAYQVQNQAYTQGQGAYNQLQELAKTGLIPQQTAMEIQGKLAQQAAINRADMFKAQMGARASLDVAGATRGQMNTAEGRAGIDAQFGQGLISGIGSGVTRAI